MANQAEAGSITAVNDELAKFRAEHRRSPEKYNALLTSIQSANEFHLHEDKRKLNSKEVGTLTIPRLIWSDSKKDADDKPDHIGMSIVPNGSVITAEEPKAAEKPEKTRAERAAEVDARMKETGNYGLRWGAGDGPAMAASDHVLNLKKK